MAACVANDIWWRPAARTDHFVAVAEQLGGNGMHVHQVVEVCADAAEDSEDHLHEERRLDPPLVDEPGDVVEVPEVVALELELRAVALAELLHDVLDVGEGVLEDEVARHLQERRLPFVLPVGALRQHRKEPEVQRANVERCHLGRRGGGGTQPLLSGHPETAARRYVEDGVAGACDLRHELQEQVRPRVWLPGVWIAGVQVNDGGARLSRFDRCARDFLGCHRQVR
jgi:hypothetical protein